jgi:hypothetical protein
MVKSGQLSEDDARQMLDSMLESGISGINAVRQEYATQRELSDHEEVQRHLESKETNVADDFNGETNLNSRTGKERTFSECDIHPRMANETVQEFGNRQAKRNDMAILTEFIPRDTDPNLTSAESAKLYSEKVEAFRDRYPRNEGESLNDYRNRIQSLAENGSLVLTNEESNPAQESPAVSPESTPTQPIPKRRGPFGRILAFFGGRRNKKNKAA